MTTLISSDVLARRVTAPAKVPGLARDIALVLLGIALLTLAAKIRIPMWPVPVTMGSFAVLTLGAAYGMRLGLVTICAYLALGALGLDMFAGAADGATGLAYMLGGTGGYLAGFVLATLVMGALAARGWDRSVPWMALAMAAGTVAIYVPGLLWLGQLHGWDKPILAWGFWPFLPGDALKLALAAMLLPLIWKVTGAR